MYFFNTFDAVRRFTAPERYDIQMQGPDTDTPGNDMILADDIRILFTGFCIKHHDGIIIKPMITLSCPFGIKDIRKITVIVIPPENHLIALRIKIFSPYCF